MSGEGCAPQWRDRVTAWLDPIQTDRDTAADLLESRGFDPVFCIRVRGGEEDRHHIVQACAFFRTHCDDDAALAKPLDDSPPLDFSVLATLDGFTTAEAKQMLGFAGELDQLAALLRENGFATATTVTRLFCPMPETLWTKLDAMADALRIAREHNSAVDELAAKLAASDGLNWREKCGYERSEYDPTAPEQCDSGTCVAAHYEDHDPSVARANYRKWATIAIAHLATSQSDALPGNS
tara:strand:+ start:92 stop:805 length:714 start_codon:yes stop_codon:yes gene_type:complete